MWADKLFLGQKPLLQGPLKVQEEKRKKSQDKNNGEKSKPKEITCFTLLLCFSGYHYMIYITTSSDAYSKAIGTQKITIQHIENEEAKPPGQLNYNSATWLENGRLKQVRPTWFSV